MLTTLIAVAGTLAGAALTGLLQQRGARADRAEARAEQRRSERIAAATELARAVSDHRRAMWERADAQFTGASEERVRELREESHRTRSAVTEPAIRVQLLHTGPVRTAADEAVQATYRMRDARDAADLQRLRRAALETHDAFVAVVGDGLTA